MRSWRSFQGPDARINNRALVLSVVALDCA
jgi:hypothetical protein